MSLFQKGQQTEPSRRPSMGRCKELKKKTTTERIGNSRGRLLPFSLVEEGLAPGLSLSY